MVPLLASLLGLAAPFNDVNIYPAIHDYMPAPVRGEVASVIHLTRMTPIVRLRGVREIFKRRSKYE